MTSLDIEIENKLLILRVDGIDTVFYILKPKLLDEITKGFKECNDEAQVMIYTSSLLAMGALEIYLN